MSFKNFFKTKFRIGNNSSKKKRIVDLKPVVVSLKNNRTKVCYPRPSKILVVLARREIASIDHIKKVLSRDYKRKKNWKRKPFLRIPSYNFRSSILGIRLEFAGRFSRAQRSYFSRHQKGRVPLNSFSIPIRMVTVPITLKYGVSTVKIWVAYPPSFRLINYAIKQLKFQYVKFSHDLPYFVKQRLFYMSFLKNQLKNTKRFKVSLKKLLLIKMLNIHFKKKKLLDNRFSNTTIYKYKKFFKIKYNFTSVNPVVLNSYNPSSFFNIFVVSKSIRLFKAKNLKSFKMFIRKPYTKIISIPAVPYMGFTKKPSEVRMGKGKGGKVAFRACPLKIGSVITLIPQRDFPILSSSRTFQKLAIYSNKFNSSKSHIFPGFF